MAFDPTTLKFDDRGLIPAIAQDEVTGEVLMMAWMNAQSITRTMATKRVTYWSRSRQSLWRKGETSGHVQRLVELRFDCDRDALRFTVRQHGEGFCHLGTWDCFDDARGLVGLERRILARSRAAPPGSYTRKLLDDPELLRAKLEEEAGELARAGTPDEVREEAADLLYFAMTRLRRCGVSLASVGETLDRRALRFTRRGGEAKTGPAT